MNWPATITQPQHITILTELVTHHPTAAELAHAVYGDSDRHDIHVL